MLKLVYKNSSWRYLGSVYEDYNFNVETGLTSFIEKFPNSTFTPWAKLCLVEWYSSMVIIDGRTRPINRLDENLQLERYKKTEQLLEELNNYSNIKNNDLFIVEYEKLLKKVKRKKRKIEWNLRK